MRMKELSVIESAVLNLIPKGSSHKINAAELERSIDLNNREVYAVINMLIKKGVPIVAVRKGKYNDRGFYIATTEQERTDGLYSLKEQVNDMNNRIRCVEKADLDNWHKHIKVG